MADIEDSNVEVANQEENNVTQPEANTAEEATQNIVVARQHEETNDYPAPAVQSENPPEMHANAVECAQSKRSPRTYGHGEDPHSSKAARYLLSLNNAAKAGDTSNTQALIDSLKEEDKQLFTDIPKELKPRGGQRISENREGSVARRADYYNENYTAPEKHESFSPRKLVDIRRPLTARYDPTSPEARKARSEGSNTSRYRGLAQGDLSCLENDPIYTPSPDSRRVQIEKEKEKARSMVVKPHSPAQLARRRGPPPKETTVGKKEADWFPANLYNLSENRNAEGKQRRADTQSRMSTHTFK